MVQSNKMCFFMLVSADTTSYTNKAILKGYVVASEGTTTEGCSSLLFTTQ